MALTLHKTFVEAFGSVDVEPRFLVDIYDGTTHWYALSGPCDAFSYPIGVQQVSPAATDRDPLTRKVQHDAVYVHLSDAFLRPILVNNILKGQDVDIKIGAKNMASANFVTYFKGIIESLEPIDEHTIAITVATSLDMLVTGETAYGAHGKHPLHHLYDGSNGVFDYIGIPAALIDTTSFWRGTYISDMSHLISDYYAEEPMEAMGYVEHIMRHLPGDLFVNTDGKISYAHFDSTQANVRTLTVDNIIPGSFKQQPLDQNVINRVTCKLLNMRTTGFGAGGGIGGLKDVTDYAASFTIDNTDSQSSYAHVGVGSRIFTHEIESSMVYYQSLLAANITNIATSLKKFLGGNSTAGNSGIADYQLSAARPAYLLLHSSHINPAIYNDEIVKAETMTRSGEWVTYSYKMVNGVMTPIQGVADSFSYSNVTRGQFGTTASPHVGYTGIGASYTHIYDVTALALEALNIIKRFGEGCPIVELNVLFRHYDLELGDFVGLTLPQYLGYGDDGMSSATKWEIIGREPDLYSTPPSVKLKLARVEVTSPTISGLTWVARPDWRQNEHTKYSTVIANTESDNLAKPIVASGMGTAIKAGFVGTVSVGIASAGEIKSELPLDQDHTFTANKDTYAFFNIGTGELRFEEETLLDPAPVAASGEVALAKVVTDGAGITVVTDLRNTTEAFVDDVVVLDQVTDGSSYKKVAGVSASNETTQISYADSSVNVLSIFSELEMSDSLNPNPDFGAWPKG